MINFLLCSTDFCCKEKDHSGKCSNITNEPLTGLPDEILKKIDKTTMTRGAQPYERVPFQNRVRRWNQTIIPFAFRTSVPPTGYDNGSIFLIRPEEYFDSNTKQKKKKK